MSEWPKSFSFFSSLSLLLVPICITWFAMLLYLAVNKNRTRESERREKICAAANTREERYSLDTWAIRRSEKRNRREQEATLGRVHDSAYSA